VVRIHFILFQF